MREEVYDHREMIVRTIARRFWLNSIIDIGHFVAWIITYQGVIQCTFSYDDCVVSWAAAFLIFVPYAPIAP